MVPDWVCEVFSKSTRRREQGPKQRIYAREGVQYLWHVDPLARTLEVFRLQGEDWLRVESFTGDGRIRAAPFEAIELELSLLWSR